MSFLKDVTKYVLEDRSPQELQSIALKGLEEGFESPSLIVLAGLSKSENPFVIEEYFKAMLKELGLNLFKKQDAALSLVQIIVGEILDNSIDTYDGCNALFREVLDFTDFRKQDVRYVYDSIDLAEVYGLYITIEELMQASEKWDNIKSNEQLIEETKVEIRNRLCKWKLGNMSK